MSEEENILEQARKLKKTFPKEMTNLEKFPTEDYPVSVFMAGSPGAGKTETAKRLIATYSSERSVIHIDPDELRLAFSGYTGDNAEQFQGAVSILADRIQDLALHHHQSFIFDGTLSDFTKAEKNINRSLKRGRDVYVIYVYQDPLQAWGFVQARTGVLGRRLPREAFIREYFDARHTVNRLIESFGSKVTFEMIVKDLDGSEQAYYKNFKKIDVHVPERYSKKELETKL